MTSSPRKISLCSLPPKPKQQLRQTQRQNKDLQRTRADSTRRQASQTPPAFRYTWPKDERADGHEKQRERITNIDACYCFGIIRGWEDEAHSSGSTYEEHDMSDVLKMEIIACVRCELGEWVGEGALGRDTSQTIHNPLNILGRSCLEVM